MNDKQKIQEITDGLNEMIEDFPKMLGIPKFLMEGMIKPKNKAKSVKSIK